MTKRAQSNDFSVMEPLEDRMLMAGGPGPRITDIDADNRGQVVLTFDSALKASTITTKSVQIITHSAAHGETALAETLAYSASLHQLTITSKVAANKSYKIKLVSKLLKGDTGARLDGEFVAAGTPTGDGVAGGDFLVKTIPAATKVARFSTILGKMDVDLFDNQTPLTVANFLKYANSGVWDGSFFHRTIPNGVIQGGGYRIFSDGIVRRIPELPVVQNEPHPGDPGNIRGTIAMAKIDGQVNSATNEWFFNLGDNRNAIDNQNGGFTVFGQISDDDGLTVMQNLGAKGIVNVGGAFTNLPVKDAAKANQTNPPKVNPKKDLLTIKRIAILVDVAAVTPATPTP